MNALAKESNVKSSLKKYFVDALGGDKVTFDTSLASPNVRKQGPGGISQWYNIHFGEFGRQVLSEYVFEIFCLSRQDAEGKQLSIMTDELFDILLDSTKTDGMRRIPLYDASTSPWTLISSMVVQEVNDNFPFERPEDETKIKVLNVRLRWGTTI